MPGVTKLDVENGPNLGHAPVKVSELSRSVDLRVRKGGAEEKPELNKDVVSTEQVPFTARNSN